ncbi:MAG: undecaprenyldiphospho-muramoylpentapeptide beta-N-acetylglucosaminyltransferase [Cytophagaceae bacterium]|nr:undecaprenyldiphospho-muramoylpentapeptide beta-N-acetylglucosaminyltransferase [Cytophagaceae bacterium]MBK9935719.1 undecaprenyldiphospho-muramoylpentapeptide beta-N-acetylglucosaminyltransferase [Cytophagaceae bacterium]MBL0302160.1 undecaprenyldiphospho-muramoylpentapeptide beta-N-acetylglucosaminyltransferase [Cytophagaceae bacterium]MBL0324980.1 undecaprenyldiphospho-muramoylpentapeptide beta-N-acetylglucosaminyltransferase [Cytophagaceae bacterium]
MKKQLKIIISGGGTGGHIFPAVAIANEIKRQRPDTEILFVGALGKMEMEKVPKAGYNIVGLPIAGFNRSNMLANFSFPIKLIKSLLKAYSVLKNFKPDMAIGVGGFASGPTLRMANFLGIKTLIQEQNSYAGVTNKILSKKAQKVCVAYPDMGKFFPNEKIVFTGNPVRSDLIDSKIDSGEARKHFGLEPDRKTLLIVGGSLGALSVNKSIAAGLQQLLNLDIQIIWQTGKTFIDQAKEKVGNLQTSRVYVSDFIYEMDQAYAAADIVISRAGALSVSELSLVAKPAILVPYPFAAEDHQTQNALSLSSKNAAVLIKDSELNEKLMDTVSELVANKEKLSDLSENIKKFAKPLAAKEIVDQIFSITDK